LEVIHYSIENLEQSIALHFSATSFEPSECQIAAAAVAIGAVVVAVSPVVASTCGKQAMEQGLAKVYIHHWCYGCCS